MSADLPEPVAWKRDGWGPDCGPYVDYCETQPDWEPEKWTALYTAEQVRAIIADRKAREAAVVEALRELLDEADEGISTSPITRAEARAALAAYEGERNG